MYLHTAKTYTVSVKLGGIRTGLLPLIGSSWCSTNSAEKQLADGQKGCEVFLNAHGVSWRHLEY